MGNQGSYHSQGNCTDVNPQNSQALPYHLSTAPSATKCQIPFYPELTLDHKTSLSSSANTCPWFVSSTHVDPRVLHTNVWDHQVSCTEYLDSLHTDGTAILAERKERESSWEGWERIYIWQEKGDQVCSCTVCVHCGESEEGCTVVKIRVGSNHQQGRLIKCTVCVQAQVLFVTKHNRQEKMWRSLSACLLCEAML